MSAGWELARSRGTGGSFPVRAVGGGAPVLRCATRPRGADRVVGLAALRRLRADGGVVVADRPQAVVEAADRPQPLAEVVLHAAAVRVADLVLELAGLAVEDLREQRQFLVGQRGVHDHGTP